MSGNSQPLEPTEPTSLFDGCSVMVTGGAGFIGRHLCTRLVNVGASVTSVSRQHRNEAISRQVDLTDYRSTKRLFEAVRPEYVFHLASHVYGAPDLRHVLPTFHNNLQTTVNVLTAAAEVGGCKKIVLTGSLVEPESRGTETVPSCPYAAAKWASSDYARMFHALYKLPVVIARVFMVYGPQQPDDTKLVPYVIQFLLQGQPPKITSGRRLIDWIYVDDVVNGYFALAQADAVEGLTLDLGSGNLIATGDLVQRICDLLPSEVIPEIGALADRPLEPERAAIVEETTRRTGWRPLVSLDDGLMRTICYYLKKAEASASV